MVFTLVPFHTLHAVIREEQLVNVFEKLFRTTVQLIIKAIKKHELFTALKETIDAKAIEIGGLTRASIAGAYINLWFVSVYVQQ